MLWRAGPKSTGPAGKRENSVRSQKTPKSSDFCENSVHGNLPGRGSRQIRITPAPLCHEPAPEMHSSFRILRRGTGNVPAGSGPPLRLVTPVYGSHIVLPAMPLTVKGVKLFKHGAVGLNKFILLFN